MIVVGVVLLLWMYSFWILYQRQESTSGLTLEVWVGVEVVGDGVVGDGGGGDSIVGSS